jgi:hypothetical protein
MAVAEVAARTENPGARGPTWKRVAEGKSKCDTMRCLNMYIGRELYGVEGHFREPYRRGYVCRPTS